MPPATWTTDDQYDWLKVWEPVYLEHTQNKTYARFWEEVFPAWFEKWPERAVLYPTVEGPLDAEQGKALGKAVDQRKEVSQHRWATGTVCAEVHLICLSINYLLCKAT